MEFDDPFVKVNEHFDAGDERMLHLRGQILLHF